MEKFDINNFDPNINYVIEASAGTGKTYNVIQIVDKLVNTYNEKLNEILIVTYTDKAAGELKDRIRSKIKGADIDNAPIYTIHSFCQNAIKEFGVSANLPFNLNVIDENELKNFTDRYLRQGEILQDISNLGCLSVLETIKETFVAAISKYYLNLNYQEDDKIISLKNIDYSELLSLKVLINKAVNFEDLFTDRPDIKYNYEILQASVDQKCNDLAAIIKENYKDHFAYNGSIYRISKKWPVEEEEKEAIEFFKKLKEGNDSYGSILVSKYLKDFYTAWQKEKEFNKNQTFDDMIRYVREAILSNDKLKNKLKKKYKRAIIDEFQDTNQKQFDIFSSIFLSDDDHKIIVVGDPKQSIYSFQGADINVYYNAVNTIVNKGGKLCVLNKNYRSTANMVSSCNALFNFYNFAGTNFENSDFLSEAINNDTQEHKAMYEGKELQALWLATDKDKMPINEKETRLFSKIAVQQIIDCCLLDENNKTKLQIKDKGEKEYRNVSFKDFAVLARTSSEMKYIENALKQAGIPFIRYKDTNLFKGIECVHWISMLKAINTIDLTGKNRKVFTKLMFTKFFGYSLEEVRSSYFDKDDIKEIIQLKKWKQLANALKWEDLFDDIMINSKLSEQMKTLKEIQSYSKFKQISNYCIEYLSSCKNIDDLIRNLENLSDGGAFEGDDPTGTTVEKSTNFDCVQIMTIHASKGLQFPVVIAVCGFKDPFSKGKAFTYHQKNEENEEKQMLCFSKGKEEKELIKQEEIAEWKRLFYVAYTRAQFLMIMPCYIHYGAKFLGTSINSLIDSYSSIIRFIEDNKLTYHKLREQSSKILSSITSEEEDKQNKEKQDKILLDMIKTSHTRRSYKHSYSSLSHDHIQDNTDEELFDEFSINKEGDIKEGLAMFDKNPKVIECNYDETIANVALPIDYPKGAKFGTAIHEVFELLDFTKYEESATSLIIDSFTNYGIERKEEWIKATSNIVENVLNATLPTIDNKTFKLKDITNKDRKNEVEFTFNLLNGRLKNFCNGFVDLIFKYDNRYYILDWKSDGLNENFISYANKESIKKHVDECYSIQRVLYSYCLIKWLKQFYKHMSEEEIFNTYFGGIYYIFVRGCNNNVSNGVYLQTWNTYFDLTKAFDEIIKEKVGGYNNG